MFFGYYLPVEIFALLLNAWVKWICWQKVCASFLLYFCGYIEIILVAKQLRTSKNRSPIERWKPGSLVNWQLTALWVSCVVHRKKYKKIVQSYYFRAPHTLKRKLVWKIYWAADCTNYILCAQSMFSLPTFCRLKCYLEHFLRKILQLFVNFF